MSRQTNSIGVFSNKTILEAETKHTETVHIILAFQWSMIAYGFIENECFVFTLMKIICINAWI